jgi:hypothetical protein
LRAPPLLAASAVLLVAGAVPRAARADSASDAARAKELFEHGRDLRNHGNCADALPLFHKAYATYPAGLGSLRNVALCDEAVGRFASARAAWLELRHALAMTSDPKYAGWTDDADRAASRLTSKVATLTIDLAVVDAPGAAGRPVAPADGVEVTVDGQALAREQLGVAIERDPGTAVVRAVGASSVAPEEATVALAAGESKHVALSVTIAAAPPPPGAAPVVESEPDATPADDAVSRASTLRTGAWIAAGVGAAGITGALISLAVRQSALSDLEADCPNYASAPCDASAGAKALSDADRGHTASTLFNVLGAVGVAGSIASVTLFALSSSPATRTAIVLTPAGVGAAGAF